MFNVKPNGTNICVNPYNRALQQVSASEHEHFMGVPANKWYLGLSQGKVFTAM